LKNNSQPNTRKVALITGASSGIGMALAWAGAQKGFNLMLSGRNTQALDDLTRALIEQYPNQKIEFLSGEISDPVFCKELIDRCIERLGYLDILINNAGISMRGILNDTDLSVLKRIMDVNFWGSVYCTKFALPYLLAKKGSVIGISSVAGFKGLPARTGYSASKFALQGFLESLRIENRLTGLHVLIACPGYTASNIRRSALNAAGIAQGETPLNEDRLMSAEDVARQIWLAYDKKSIYAILTLQGKMAVWINKLSPKIADWLTFKVIRKEPQSPF
jgi:short-subunit dehydrogenase